MRKAIAPLTVVSFAVSEPEQAFFQNEVTLVPQRDGKTQPLLFISDSAQAIFAPPVSPGARLIMSEIIPCVSIRAVVLADRAHCRSLSYGPHFFHGIPASRASFSRFCSAKS
jgi:hypothetical protein